MINFPFYKIYQYAFVLIVNFFAVVFYSCDCTNIRDFVVNNIVIPDSSLNKYQFSSPDLLDSKVKDFPFNFTLKTTFVEA